MTLAVLSGVVGLAVLESLSEPHMSPTVRFLLRLFHIIPRPPYSNFGPAMPPLSGGFWFAIVVVVVLVPWKTLGPQ